MTNILGELNSNQKKAVEHTEGPLLILAGAGSGKTRVITYRIAYLINKGIKPYNILAVTFTNKAADEMKQRVSKLISDKRNMVRTNGGISDPATMSIPLICTFHSFCVRVLRQDIDKIGRQKDFIIYDELEQISLIKDCFRELRIDEKKFKIRVFANSINKAKDALIDFESYQIYAAASGNNYRDIVGDIYKLYQTKLDRNNALDFGDLIMKAVQLWKKKEEVLEKYQDRFRYIMVDEYQDTNPAQYMLIKLLAQKYKNICVVGDDDQSIYMWRGADMRNILHFEKDYNKPNQTVYVLRMMDNYRSSQAILDAANNLIKNNTQRRHDKGVLYSAKGKIIDKDCFVPSGVDVKFQELLSETEEAQYVVSEIKSIINKKNVSGDNIAIFYRTNAQSRVFEDILRKEKINYTMLGSVEFYERREIKDILSYLRLIVNPFDSVALKRIINVPHRGIGKTSVAQLESFAQKEDISLYEALANVDKINAIQESKRPILRNFWAFIEKFKEQNILGKTASELAGDLINEVGYIKTLESEDTFEAQARIENIKELISAIKEFEERVSFKSIQSFLEQICLTDNAGVSPEGCLIESNQNSKSIGNVMLMTLHLAKGLEFNYVFITGLEEGLLPHINSMDSEEKLEEERRLCYVGMTRAKKKLYLTCAAERRLYGNRRLNMSSRFINEAGIKFQSTSINDEHLTKLSDTYNESVTSPPNETEDFWHIGQKVQHPTFGWGKIVEKDGSDEDMKMVVLFNNGQKKKLLAKYANLKKC